MEGKSDSPLKCRNFSFSIGGESLSFNHEEVESLDINATFYHNKDKAINFFLQVIHA